MNYFFKYLLPLLFFPFLSKAQKTVDYQFGASHKSFKMEHGTFFEYAQNNKILSAKIKGKSLCFQLFDTKKLEQLEQNIYNDFPPNFVFEGLVDFQDKFYCFYSLWDETKKTEQLFVREIDFETAKFKDLGRCIVSHQGKLSGTFFTGKAGLRSKSWKSFWAIGVFNKFTITFSKERTRLLIQYKLAHRTSPSDQTPHLHQETMGFHVFDKNMTELKSKKIKLPYYIYQIEPIELYINDNDAISIFAKVYPDIKKPVSSDYSPKRLYRYELFKVDFELAQMRPRKIYTPEKEHKLTQFGLFENINGEIIITGSYTIDKEFELNFQYTEGFYIFTIKKNGRIDKKFYEIPTPIIEEYQDLKTKEKKGLFYQTAEKELLKGLQFNKVILNEDGSLLVIGEQYRRFSTQWNFEYTHGDLLVMKIGPDGILKWMKRLHKYQENTTYKHFRLGESECFIFQGHPTYTMLSEEAIDQMGYKVRQKNLNLLLCYKVHSESSEVQLLSIFDIKKASSVFTLNNYQANLIFPISNHEFIIEYGIQNNESVLIKIDLTNK